MIEELLQKELRRVLDYNPDTGTMTWKVSINRGVPAESLAGSVRNDGRLRIEFRGKKYYAHRLAWLFTYGKWPEKFIDHIDGNPLNNRIKNLRDVSNKTNSENRRKPRIGNTSGFLGVSLHKKSGKFSAQIQVSGRLKHLGYFITAEEAHEVYLTAKRELHEGSTI